MQNIDIFIAYSQADIAQVKDLEKHLAALERSYPVKIWYDGMIEAGKEWEAEVNAAMDRAEIILLMISSDFIASDFWYEKAIPHILHLHKNQKVDCLPILVRKCMWEDTPIAEMKLLPATGKTIVNEEWGTDEEPYIEIAKAVKAIVMQRLDINPEAQVFENKTQSPKKYLYIVLAVALVILGSFFVWQKISKDKSNKIAIEKAVKAYQKHIALGNIMLQGQPTLDNYIWAREQYEAALSQVRLLPTDTIQAFTRKEKCSVEIEAKKKYIIVDKAFIETVFNYQTALDTAHTFFLEAIALHKKGEIVNAANRYRTAFHAYRAANRVAGNASVDLGPGNRGHFFAQREMEAIEDNKTILSSPIFSADIKIVQEMDAFERNIALFMQRKSEIEKK